MALLEVQDLSIHFGGVKAVQNVSFSVDAGIVYAVIGPNGAGKTTTLRAISNLLQGERGAVTKGSIELRGERIENLSPADLVQRGVVQVMEGRHCFAHLTIEENLMTGSYTRSDKGEIAANLEKVYNYFPRLKTRRTSQAAYTSGGEQQMCAIGRALMANPSMVLLDEPSMGLAPQIVEEVFEIVKDLNAKERVTFLLAEQNTTTAWISFSCKDGEHNVQGERLADCVAALEASPHIVAIGVNCTAPEHVASLVEQAKTRTTKPVLVYPNSGEQYDAVHKRWLGCAHDQAFAEQAAGWCTILYMDDCLAVVQWKDEFVLTLNEEHPMVAPALPEEP